jgi:hypothetical protein
MRIWDIEPERLCRKHLLAEHRELHALWVVLTEGKKGYSKHPETLRWRGKLAALSDRHERLVEEMLKRGYRHHSPLLAPKDKDSNTQDVFINTYEEQLSILRAKGCGCNTELN